MLSYLAEFMMEDKENKKQIEDNQKDNNSVEVKETNQKVDNNIHINVNVNNEVKNLNENHIEGNKEEVKLTKKQQFLQFLKFLGFSISAGVIQILSFELLYNWIGWKVWWASYLISVFLSVVWNFTFNRKFTFKSASNVPMAMLLVLLYYCAFTPLSVFGGDALEGIGWNGTLVTLMMMAINFLTEFVWDKFVVFNDKLMGKIIKPKSHNNNHDN